MGSMMSLLIIAGFDRDSTDFIDHRPCKALYNPEFDIPVPKPPPGMQVLKFLTHLFCDGSNITGPKGFTAHMGM